MALVLLDLPDEVFFLVCRALGVTCGGLVSQTRLRLTCMYLYACLSLHFGDDVRVRLSLAQLATYVHWISHRPLYVLELSSLRVVTLSWDKQLLKHDFENNPSSRCRLFLPDDTLVWYLDSHHCVGLFDHTNVHTWLKSTSSIRQLKLFCKDEDTLALISKPESEVVQSRRTSAFQPSWHTTWKAVLSHLNTPSNQSIAELELDAYGVDAIPSPLSVSNLLSILPRLRTLKLRAIPLDSPSTVLRNAKDIVHLDLSDSVTHADGLLCLHIGHLLRKWRSHSLHDKKVMIMDNVSFDPRYVSRVVSGAWDKDVGTLDAESDSSFTVSHGDATPLLYLSLSLVLWDTWQTAIKEVYQAQKDLLAVEVKLTSRSLAASSSLSVPPPKRQKKAKLLSTVAGPPPPPVVLPTAVLDGNSYSNSTRERDRYMIQWYDFRCKSCGCVWNKRTPSQSAFGRRRSASASSPRRHARFVQSILGCRAASCGSRTVICRATVGRI